jgi:hypothetical protein
VRQAACLRLPGIEGHPAKRRTAGIASQVTGVFVGSYVAVLCRTAKQRSSGMRMRVSLGRIRPGIFPSVHGCVLIRQRLALHSGTLQIPSAECAAGGLGIDQVAVGNTMRIRAKFDDHVVLAASNGTRIGCRANCISRRTAYGNNVA